MTPASVAYVEVGIAWAVVAIAAWLAVGRPFVRGWRRTPWRWKR
jgi:hypothetical protein